MRSDADWRRYVRTRLPALNASAEREAEIVEELASQMAATYERERGRGASDTLARERAEAEVTDWPALARTLGLIERPPHSSHALDSPGGGLMNGMISDLRHSLRSLRRAPAFTAVSLVTLALGLGLAVAAFAVVDTVLVRPLRFPSPEQLVLLHASVPPQGGDTVELTYPDAADLAQETSVFQSLSVVMTYAGTATALDPPQRIEGFDVATTLFDTLGVSPIVGRGFTAAEGVPGQDGVVILSHGFWQQLGGRADIIGQTLVLDDVPKTIVGVMPAGFSIEVLTLSPSVYRPIAGDHFAARNRAFRAFRGIGRLQPGVSIEQANAVVAALGERLAREYPTTNAGRAFKVHPLRDDVVGASRASLLMVTGLVVLVLAIAGVNLASLLLARAVARAREMSLRGALGASRWRLARGPMTEAALLSLGGAALGIVVAQALLTTVTTAPGITLPREAEMTVDWRAIAALAVAAFGAVITIGLIPFLLHRRMHDTAVLRTGHETSGAAAARLRSGLVVGQTAFAFILVAATVLLAISLQRVLAQPLGFEAGVATMRVSVPAPRYPEKDDVVRFYNELLDEIAARPTIEKAGFVSILPLSGNAGSSLTIQGREDIPEAERPGIGWQWVNPTYFDAMGIPIVRGRGFTPADAAHPAHVTVINETLARLNFPGEDPIGRRVYFGPVPASGVPEWHEIIGVAGDVRHRSLEGEPDARAYDLFGQHWGRTVSLAVRSTEPLPQTAATIRGLIGRRDPGLAVFAVRTTDELVSNAVRTRRMLMWLVAMFAAIGFSVALLGVYGMVACMVEERRRELGVRLALGATVTDIHRLIVGHGLRLVAGGLALGLIGAIALRRGIEAQLFNVTATQVPALIGVAAVVLASAALTCVIGSRRATQVDPVTVLRSE